MNVDSLVGELRRRLQLQGFPTEHHTWLLAALLMRAGQVNVEIGRCLQPYSLRYPDRRAEITLPDEYAEEEKARALLEELGHVLWGSVYAVVGNSDHSRRRLQLLWEDREESRADEFCLAWRLPADALCEFHGTDEELAAESGCSLQQIQERRRQLVQAASRGIPRRKREEDRRQSG